MAEALARVGLETHRQRLSAHALGRPAAAGGAGPGAGAATAGAAAGRGLRRLDARLREQVRDDTLHVLQTAGVPALIVTHDAEEAMFLADRIALMRAGRVVQLGTPETLYLHPAEPFVATFLGEVNRMPARVRGAWVETAMGLLPRPAGCPLPDGPAEMLLRPEGLRVGVPGLACRRRSRPAGCSGRPLWCISRLPDGAGGPAPSACAAAARRRTAHVASG